MTRTIEPLPQNPEQGRHVDVIIASWEETDDRTTIVSRRENPQKQAWSGDLFSRSTNSVRLDGVDEVWTQRPPVEQGLRRWWLWQMVLRFNEEPEQSFPEGSADVGPARIVRNGEGLPIHLSVDSWVHNTHDTRRSTMEIDIEYRSPKAEDFPIVVPGLAGKAAGQLKTLKTP